MTETRVENVCAEDVSVAQKALQIEDVLDMFRRLNEHLAWTRCHYIVTHAENVGGEYVSITQKALQIEDVQYVFTTSSICLEDGKNTLHGHVVNTF